MKAWIAGWMKEWVNGWLDKSMNELLAGWKHEWLAGWKHEWMAGWMKTWMAGWMKAWMTDWMPEWLAGWKHEWMSGKEWMNLRLRPLRKPPTSWFTAEGRQYIERDCLKLYSKHAENFGLSSAWHRMSKKSCLSFYIVNYYKKEARLLGHILDGNSEHVAHAWRTKVFSEKQNPIYEFFRSYQMP